MEFLSAAFLLGFLPACLGGFFLLRHLRPGACTGFLALASLGFLAASSALSLAVILVSVLVNRACGLAMARWPVGRTAALLVGIAGNIGAIAWFKFHPVPLGDSASAMLVVGMPLGLSFYAFKQITYLIDRHQNRAPDLSLPDYLLFSVFFAHLPAGPITPYRRLQPQIAALARQRIDPAQLLAGLALIVLGAVKFRVLSGQIAGLTVPIYAAAERGAALCLPESIAGSFGFLLELYFNFSGYSDMAIGLALLFGLRLSPNFDSPVQARQLGDYILRWHMSFMQFARDYVFVYLQAALTQILPLRSAVRRRVAAWGIAILVTYVLVMLWHAASWTALVISLLTAAAVVAAGLARMRSRAWEKGDGVLRRIGGHLVCLFFATVTIVFFRSGDAGTAMQIFEGLTRWPGVPLLLGGPAPAAEVCPVLSGTPSDLALLAVLAAASGIALLAPNTMRLFGLLPARPGAPVFRPTVPWAIALGLLAWLAWIAEAPLSGGVIYEGF
jgi:D-alanyl-lipoteichoic acid acyltransferase DltB (MBOAT superfamily)